MHNVVYMDEGGKDKRRRRKEREREREREKLHAQFK